MSITSFIKRIPMPYASVDFGTVISWHLMILSRSLGVVMLLFVIAYGIWYATSNIAAVLEYGFLRVWSRTAEYVPVLKRLEPELPTAWVNTELDTLKIDWNNPCFAAVPGTADAVGVPAKMLTLLIWHESRGNVRAINKNTDGSIDRGCGQLNNKYFDRSFDNPEDVFVAPKNVAVAAKHLKSCFERTGNWDKAALCYHSQTPIKQVAYQKSLNNSGALINAEKVNQTTVLASIFEDMSANQPRKVRK